MDSGICQTSTASRAEPGVSQRTKFRNLLALQNRSVATWVRQIEMIHIFMVHITCPMHRF
jgi:hypothetical protein